MGLCGVDLPSARGVADDKGPVLAVARAAADLLRARKLGVDLLFLVEGEEETGSGGFVDAVLRHKVRKVYPAPLFPVE